MAGIRLLVMDVDGTLTDGRIYMGPQGEAMKAFHVQDGYGIAQLLPRAGIVPAIITGRCSAIVEQRARELHIEELHQGVSDKLGRLQEIARRQGISAGEIAYIGDDLNDLACMRFCGMSACPSDAVPEVRGAADYVCKREGGRGAVREYIDHLIALAEAPEENAL